MSEDNDKFPTVIAIALILCISLFLGAIVYKVIFG